MDTQYAIQSKSEQGFWHNENGWVYSIVDATLFEHTEYNLPVTSGNDAQWIVHTFSDN